MAPGDIVSHYRVVSRLGQGGMGQVWLAEDTLLGRQVALKIIWPHLACDPEGMRRFEQEAKAVAALNHPNIAQIHEFGRHEGTRFLVMEFVDGVRLTERLESGPLQAAEIVDVGAQVAEALEEAHSKGITHRDIKPGNIMLTGRGRVKILDFGLAKVRSQVAASAEDTSTVTGPGEVVGTLRYMSPEQAQGEEVDSRSDIFSLGAVLYEMAAGRPAFPGTSPASVFDGVVRRSPAPVAQANRAIAPELDRIIAKALEKDRAMRYQTASDLAADLRRFRRDMEAPPRASTSRRGYLVAAALAVALAAVGGALAWRWVGQRRAAQNAPLEAKPLTTYPGSETQPTFSPDGNQVAFAWNAGTEANWDVYVKVLDSGTPLRLTNNPATDYSPAWSPDGRTIAFLRQSDADSAFYLIPALGGPERRICSASPHRVGVDAPYIAWAPDGKSVALSDKAGPDEPMAIFLLSLAGGERRRLTNPPPKTYGDGSMAFSPDGRLIVFVRTASLGVQDLYVVPVSGGEPRRLVFDSRRIYGLAWNQADGSILFSSSRGGNSRLWRMTLNSPPERVNGVGENASFIALSRDGKRLAFTRGLIDTNVWRYELPGPGARGGGPQSIIASTRHEQGPQYSPDGQRIVFASTRSGAWEIWACDKDGRNTSQLTFYNEPAVGSPYWSPDGRYVAFDARPGGNADVYVIGAEGGSPRRLTDDPADDIVPSWSRDGRWIYFASNRTFTYEIWKAPAGGGPAVQVTRKGGFHGIESPDGKYLYYARSPNLAGLWRVPVGGGEEVPIIPDFRAGFWGYWAVASGGIYYLGREETSANEVRYHLNFLGFGSGREKRILEFQRRPFNSGLAISPDGRWCLYTQADRSDTDIFLVDGFH